ncbi:hypothetical protein [Rhodococcus sp. Chr-9]|uniref:hypothetical protein n=1 Tax=Rhodococcus sp. Chr-9 TaxID=713612 RepID=UPI0005759E17|nr:hypothetical protein [Rhodococcus sp. Chr-9]KHJ73394.1 hypothetical protein QR64_07250 [Rhodococcus sp. Chr-9]
MSNGLTRGQQNLLDRTLSKLEHDGGRIPAPLTEARDRLTQLATDTSELDTPDQLRNRIVSDLLDGNNIKATAWAELVTINEKHRVYSAAVEAATTAYVAVAHQHADDILREVRRVWFDPAVEELTTLATQVTPHDTVEKLLRARRTDDATKLAQAPLHLDTIRKAHELHRALYNLTNVAARDWRNPDLPTADTRDVDTYLAAIRAGNTPWLPTETELTQLLQQRQEAYRAEQENARAANRRRMSVGL